MEINKIDNKTIAEQLRRPNGEFATKVGEIMNEGNRQINLDVIDALNLSVGDEVLEIGMGNGFFVKEILSKKKELKYTGCDFSKEMVEQSIQLNATFVASGQADFYLNDGVKLPFEKETYDKVFTINTLYFWKNEALTLHEIWNVLKPKGQLTIAIRPKSVMQLYPFTEYGFKMFDKEEVIRLLEQNNFKVTEVVENEEPSQDFGGVEMRVANCIVRAQKI